MLQCICCQLIDWLICDWFRDLTVPTHLGLNWQVLCAPYRCMGAPVALLKVQMPPRLTQLMSSVSKKKEPRYACLSEALASHSQRVWAEVSSCAAHLLHNGLSDSPTRWRYLLRVLCPGRRPVTALDWVLLRERTLALQPDRVPKLTLDPGFGCHQDCMLLIQCCQFCVLTLLDLIKIKFCFLYIVTFEALF